MSSKNNWQSVFAAFVVGLVLVAIGFCLQAAIYIYGWGLTPKSWPVIIGGFVGLIFFKIITDGFVALLKDNDGK